MLVGEQPGDGEDRAGRPFVGPAGRMLDQALEEAGIDRELAYVTNVVKHFKFERRGKLRLHKKPNAEQVHACFPWLESELAVVRPRVLVLLGATAAQALLGSSFRVSRQRGEFLDSDLAPGSWPPSTPPPSSAPPTRRPAPWPTRASSRTWPWSPRNWRMRGLRPRGPRDQAEGPVGSPLLAERGGGRWSPRS